MKYDSEVTTDFNQNDMVEVMPTALPYCQNHSLANCWFFYERVHNIFRRAISVLWMINDALFRINGLFESKLGWWWCWYVWDVLIMMLMAHALKLDSASGPLSCHRALAEAWPAPQFANCCSQIRPTQTSREPFRKSETVRFNFWKLWQSCVHSALSWLLSRLCNESPPLGSVQLWWWTHLRSSGCWPTALTWVRKCRLVFSAGSGENIWTFKSVCAEAAEGESFSRISTLATYFRQISRVRLLRLLWILVANEIFIGGNSVHASRKYTISIHENIPWINWLSLYQYDSVQCC